MPKARKRTFRILLLLLACAVGLAPAGASGASASLTTAFSGNVTYQGNMFNVTAKPGSDITITAFDINLYAYTQPVPIRVYYRDGGYEGYETNAGAWTLLQETNVAANSVNTPTPLPLSSGLPIPAGKTYGIYIAVNASHDVAEMIYMYAASVYEDSYIRISTATSLAWPLFTNPNTPRTWSGTIYYTYTPLIPQTGDTQGARLWLYGFLLLLSAAAITRLARRYGV